MMRKSNPVAYRLAALAGLVVGACGLVLAEAPAYAPSAQATHNRTPKPSPAHAAPAAPTTPATAPSLLNHPALPAQVTLNAGKLSVQADNSILADILHQVSKDSGMKIEGLDSGPAADRRIFGTYGPGAPRDVLSDLLSGSGYNFLMLGDTSSGAPRELALTARGGAAAPSAAPHPAPTANTDQEQNNPDEPISAHQPDEPQNSPEPPPGPPEIQNPVRTPQQMLQELQKMREQQQQQQEQQQQEQPQQDQPDQPDQTDQPPDQQPD